MIKIPRPVDQKPVIFIRVLKHMMTLLGNVTVTGYEHLNGPHGKVIVCNHVGWVDPLWIGYAVFPHTLHQMAKKELFDNRIIGWFVRSGGGFPVDRGRPSAATIKHAVSLVAEGHLVLIFPGGTRSREDADSKRGAATIALRAKGQIIPAYYDGPNRLRLIHLLRRPKIHITFGTPIAVSEDMQPTKEAALQLTSELDQAMKTISQEC